MRLTHRCSKVLATALFGMLATGSVRADTLLRVTVSTGSIAGSSGFLDFQFNPGADSQPGFVQLENFTSDGSLNGGPQVSGAVSGTLPGVVRIDNTTGFNDYFQPFDYGQTFSFLLDLGGPAITSPNGTSTSGSSFGLGLFDSNQNPLLTIDPNGFAAVVQVNLDGTTTPQVFPSNANGGPPVTTVAAVPEPGTLASLGIGMILILTVLSGRRDPPECPARRPSDECPRFRHSS
jgi:PEP-CTERM motif